MRTLIVCCMVLYAGCQVDERDQPFDPHTVLARMARIELDSHRLSCRPEDYARDIVIASRFDDGPADLELHCDALRRMRRGINTSLHFEGLPARRRVAAALDTAEGREALLNLLIDASHSCVVETRGATVVRATPEVVARGTLSIYPVEALRPRLEAADARDRAVGPSRSAGWVLAVLDKIRGYRPATREQDIDEMVAEGTPEAFERLIAFLADGMPWNDGAPPPTPEELVEIDAHVHAQLTWLFSLARAPDGLDCEMATQRALTNGTLGTRIMASLEDIDSAGHRDFLLSILAGWRPDGFSSWVCGIAARDPDRAVRNAANTYGSCALMTERRAKQRHQN